MNRRTTNRLRPAAVGLAALLVLIVVYALVRGNDDGSNAPEDAPSSSAAAPTTSAAPALSSEPALTNPAPSASTTNPPAPEPSPTPYSPSSTTQPPSAAGYVHVAFASYNAATQSIEVSAGAPAIATEQGMCTLSATNGPAQLELNQDAEFDGHGASCGLMVLPVAGQPAGDWTVTVSFTSPMGDAASDPVTVTVG